MNLSRKLALSTCLMSFVGLSASVYANGLPATDCCDQVTELDSRVKRLEDKAVEGDTKKIYFSGHINRAITWVDDGVQSNTAHVDNDNYASQVHLDGEAAYNDDVSVGFGTTIRLYTNSTRNNTAHSAQTAGGAEGNFGLTRADIFVTSKKLGTITAGHGSMASYGCHHYTHLSGAYNFVEPYTTAERSQFRTKNAVGPFAAGTGSAMLGLGTNLGPVAIYNPGDSVNISGRADRVMYMSPRIYGFSVGGSHGYHNSGDLWDVTARFAGKFGNWITVANTAFARNHTREGSITTPLSPGETGPVGANGTGVKFDNISASAAILAPFSVTGKDGTGIVTRFSYARRNYDKVAHKDGRVLRGTLSYKDMFTDMGMTIFEGTYGHYRNMTLAATPANTLIGKSWIVGVQQNIDSVGTELYASYTNMKLNIKNSAFRFHDQDIVLVGARVKF